MSQAQSASTGDATFAVPPGMLGPDAPQLTYAEIQALVDRSAHDDFYVLPATSFAPVEDPQRGGAVGFQSQQPLHRFEIEMGDPAEVGGLKASNAVRGRLGTLALDVRMVPWDFIARPDRQPPAAPIDFAASQRFMLRRARFSFDGSGLGSDGFDSFGTGRTYPMRLGGRNQLIFAAVGTLLEGYGTYAGAVGNYTLCGELRPGEGFRGHIMLRMVDADGHFRRHPLVPTTDELVEDPHPDITYLTYLAQKGNRTKSENAFSVAPDGQVRGVNIPVDLKEVHLRGRGLDIGHEIGKEIGFGRETKARGPGSGSTFDPFQFEGVSSYDFYDRSGNVLATFAANFLEGRTFAMGLEGAPGVPALRFSYYGAITEGRGALDGLAGHLYGAAGSVFLPPPAEHVISNLYVARVADPGGRLRLPVGV